MAQKVPFSHLRSCDSSPSPATASDSAAAISASYRKISAWMPFSKTSLFK